MSDQTTFTILTVLVILGVMLLLPPTRAILTGLVSFLMAPAMKQGAIHAGLFLFWAVKRVTGAHWTLIWHLTRPRSAIFPSLKVGVDRKKGGKTV